MHNITGGEPSTQALTDVDTDSMILAPGAEFSNESAVAIDETPISPNPGKFEDDYMLLNEIGRGGYSIVYKCRHK